MTTSGLANTGGGSGTVTNTYGYDEADRLTSWTATPASGTATTQTYGYDNNGNLTSRQRHHLHLRRPQRAGLRQQRQQLHLRRRRRPGRPGQPRQRHLPPPPPTPTASRAPPGRPRRTARTPSDRLVSVGQRLNGSYNIALTYDGMTNEVASDSSASYSRDPAGAITGVDTASGQRMLALNDQHDDLSGRFHGRRGRTGRVHYATTRGAACWRPPGPSIQVGYQGQWTDPVTQQVNMGARFYRPATGRIRQPGHLRRRRGRCPRSPMTCTPTPTTTP